MPEFKRVVVWFSAGVTSTIAAKIALNKYRDIYPVLLVNTDTGSEHYDNFRFISECEEWLDCPVKILKNQKYEDTLDVYCKDRYLVGVHGARCSLVLKKKVRQEFENVDTDLQIFGFDKNEQKRAERFLKNNPLVNARFPLIEQNLIKDDCHRMLLDIGIKRPLTYNLGFPNANCLRTGCVKGQMGYWNHIRKVFPDAFWNMAEIERKLNVAICKKYRSGRRIRVFLDELPKNAGNFRAEGAIQCGLFCESGLQKSEVN
jgi:3'-phosphoadenosine 5'-phosphosulfate sulfotransferase (PAPS reductase)/FAD synthetase